MKMPWNRTAKDEPVYAPPTKTVDYSDLTKMMKDLGYGIVFDKDGKPVAIPSNLTPTELSEFGSRWSALLAGDSGTADGREGRLKTYAKMDISGAESAMVLDTYADELTVNPGNLDPIIIDIDNPKAKKEIMYVLERNNVLGSVREDIRNLAKNGDMIYKIFTTSGRIEITPPSEKDPHLSVDHLKNCFKKEDIILDHNTAIDYELEGLRSRVYRCKIRNKSTLEYSVDGDEVLDPWEYSLFSVRSRDSFPYGSSILEKMRVPYEQLVILEQFLAISRANKVDKLAISLPSMGSDPSSILAKLTTLKSTLKSIILGSPGNRMTRPQDSSLTEYLWLPEGFKAERMSTSVDLASTADVEYFRDKFYNASRLPKGYFLSDQSAQRGAALKQQDIKFARSLLPLGAAYVDGMTRLCYLIGFLLGYNISNMNIKVRLATSPYLTSEALQAYKDALTLIDTYNNTRRNANPAFYMTDSIFTSLASSFGLPDNIFKYRIPSATMPTGESPGGGLTGDLGGGTYGDDSLGYDDNPVYRGDGTVPGISGTDSEDDENGGEEAEPQKASTTVVKRPRLLEHVIRL
jgi:hypothetical protein